MFWAPIPALFVKSWDIQKAFTYVSLANAGRNTNLVFLIAAH